MINQLTPLSQNTSHRSYERYFDILKEKTADCLHSKEQLREYNSLFGVIRHGKTANIDNEGDSPKDENMGLDLGEFTFETSTVARTAEQIVSLGFKKVVLYKPGDTLRNTQTTELLEKYLKKIKPDLIIEYDTGFAHISMFEARKQITLDVYTELLSKSYLTDSERSQIMNYKVKKHVLGEKRKIILSESTKEKLQVEDSLFLDKINALYEESYSTIIDKAGKGIDAFRKYISTNQDKDTFHALVAYRTTLQACDQVMKSNKDLTAVDSFFDIGFAQMNVVGCDEYGNSVHALSMNSWSYDPKTYDDDIAGFHQFYDKISNKQTVQENRTMINTLLLQTEFYLESHIKNNQEWIKRREDLLSWFLQKPLPPMLARRVIETLLSNYDQKKDVDETFKKSIERVIGVYLETNPQETDKLLKLLWSYKKVNESWKMVYSQYAHNREIVGWLQGNKEVQSLEGIIESNEKKFAQFEDIYVYIDRDPVPLNQLYCHQNINVGGHIVKDVDLAKYLLSQSEDRVFCLESPRGSGKSLFSRYLFSELLSNAKSGFDVHYIHADMINSIESGDIQSVFKQQYSSDSANNMLVIDGFDEIDHEKAQMIESIITDSPSRFFVTSRPGFLSDEHGFKTVGLHTKEKKDVEKICDTYDQFCRYSDKGLLRSVVMQLFDYDSSLCTPLFVKHVYGLDGDEQKLQMISQAIKYKDNVSFVIQSVVFDHINSPELNKDLYMQFNNNQYIKDDFKWIRKNILEECSELKKITLPQFEKICKKYQVDSHLMIKVFIGLGILQNKAGKYQAYSFQQKSIQDFLQVSNFMRTINNNDTNSQVAINEIKNNGNFNESVKILLINALLKEENSNQFGIKNIDLSKRHARIDQGNIDEIVLAKVTPQSYNSYFDEYMTALTSVFLYDTMTGIRFCHQRLENKQIGLLELTGIVRICEQFGATDCKEYDNAKKMFDQKSHDRLQFTLQSVGLDTIDKVAIQSIDTLRMIFNEYGLMNRLTINDLGDVWSMKIGSILQLLQKNNYPYSTTFQEFTKFHQNVSEEEMVKRYKNRKDNTQEYYNSKSFSYFSFEQQVEIITRSVLGKLQIYSAFDLMGGRFYSEIAGRYNFLTRMCNRISDGEDGTCTLMEFLQYTKKLGGVLDFDDCMKECISKYCNQFGDKKIDNVHIVNYFSSIDPNFMNTYLSYKGVKIFPLEGQKKVQPTQMRNAFCEQLQKEYDLDIIHSSSDYYQRYDFNLSNLQYIKQDEIKSMIEKFQYYHNKKDTIDIGLTKKIMTMFLVDGKSFTEIRNAFQEGNLNDNQLKAILYKDCRYIVKQLLENKNKAFTINN